MPVHVLVMPLNIPISKKKYIRNKISLIEK